MFNNKCTKLVAAMGITLSAGVAQAAIQDVAVNGDFETGDLTGWLSFPSPAGTTGVVNDNSDIAPGNTGSFAGQMNADGSGGPSFPILKLERLAEGLLTDGAAVTVSYDVYSPLQTVDINGGDFVGQVVFIAELFTERTGDNGATNQILQGPPTWVTPGWQRFTFNTFLGADAGGGVSLLFKADCGANPNCRFDARIDNVSIVTDVSAVPVPAAVWLFGSGLLGLVGVARRKKALAA